MTPAIRKFSRSGFAVATALVFLSLSSLSTSAATLSSAWAAYERGEFSVALAEWNTLSSQGEAEAMFNVGVLYLEGKGVLRDKAMAHKMWRQAASLGHSKSLHNLALGYIAGDVDTQLSAGPQYTRALDFLNQAANQGFANSLYTLGKMYGYGLGVDIDLDRKLEYFTKAANMGSVKAQYNLGKAYRDGDGVSRDDTLSATWFRMAAEQGYGKAQTHYSTRLAKGLGVPADDVEALKWALLAQAQGILSVKDNIKVLKLRMTDNQLAQAAAMVQSFQPSSP